MAHYQPTAGFESFTGAISKKKDQSHMLVTRRKRVKDPLTGEVVGHGPKEIYAQNPRDYKYHPLTAGEQTQRSKWREACREASAIVRDKSHPRYMEMYERWRAQLTDKEPANSSAAPCMQFPNFVRAVLVKELQKQFT